MGRFIRMSCAERVNRVMDIFGIGGWELFAILLIMLIVAGPKRMIQWSYTLGRYVGALRRMWAETAAALQKELNAAGVDIEVPKELPNRAALNREMGRTVNKLAQPLKEPLREVQRDLDTVRETTAKLNFKPQSSTVDHPAAQRNGDQTTGQAANPAVKAPPDSAAPPSTPDQDAPKPSDFGTWSGRDREA